MKNKKQTHQITLLENLKSDLQNQLEGLSRLEGQFELLFQWARKARKEGDINHRTVFELYYQLCCCIDDYIAIAHKNIEVFFDENPETKLFFIFMKASSTDEHPIEFYVEKFKSVFAGEKEFEQIGGDSYCRISDAIINGGIMKMKDTYWTSEVDYENITEKEFTKYFNENHPTEKEEVKPTPRKGNKMTWGKEIITPKP